MKKVKADKIHLKGDKHFIEGEACVVRFVNAGIGFLFPLMDDEDNGLVARHICFAKIWPDGKVTKI